MTQTPLSNQFPGGSYLDIAVAEIETHVGAAGWDQAPQVYALVRAAQVMSEDPDVAARLGIDRLDPDVLTPIEQAELPDGQLDEVLAQIEWPSTVAGCAVSQEIVILPPEAEADLAGDDPDSPEHLTRAATHPLRREARLIVGVTRSGSSTTLLRMRGDDEDELLSGSDLAPNLVTALLATLT